MMPALLMSTSRPPKRCTASATSRSAPAGMRTSQVTASTSAPRASRSLRARSSSSSSLAQRTMRAPRLASSRQRTNPRPREPPVTSTTAPRRSALGASQRARTATDAAPAANASPFFMAVPPPGGRSAPDASGKRSRRSGGRKPVLADLVRLVPCERNDDVSAVDLEHLAVAVPPVSDLVAEAELRSPCLRRNAVARGGGRSRYRDRLLAVVAAAACLAGLFREVLAQRADAAAGRLRVAHHLLESIAIAGMALFVGRQEPVELLRPQRPQRDHLLPLALGNAAPDELCGDHLDLLLGQIGPSRELPCAGRTPRDG